MCKRTHVRGLSLDRQIFLTKLKTGSSRLKTVRTAENVERVAHDEQHA